jgi:DNA-directed RNA polymerase specialized sigma24 family protein
MTLEDIRDEHASVRVGHLILEEVRQSCRRLAKRSYPPRIYADAPTWHDEALEDLVQDVITDRLIKERQIEFMVDASSSLREFRTFLDRQVRITLAKRRERTVIDNLIDRSMRILREGAFEVALKGRQPAYRLTGTEPEQRDPTDEEIRSAAARVRPIPRGIGHGAERAPAVYRDEDLRTLLRVVFEDLPTVVRVRDLDRILRDVLTEWTVSVLVPYVDASANWASDVLALDEEQEVTEAVESLLADLDNDARTVLASKLAGLSDAELAQALGVSRPTAAKRKNSVNGAIATSFGPLSGAARSEAMRRLGASLVGEAP